MQNKFATLVVAGLMALTAQSQAFNTTITLDILTPISGGSGVFTLKVGSFQGTLSADSYTAFQQLSSASWVNGATFTNLDGSSISGGSPAYLAAQNVNSPYSDSVGADNSVYFWLTDTSSTTFALMKGIDTYWWDGQGAGTTDNFGIAGDSVTAVFGTLNTSAGGGVGAIGAVGIPEPASGSLFLIGAAGVLALRRLRKTNV